MRRFLVVIEKANGNYSAYSPDLPGCIATGRSVSDTETKMYEAMRLHLQGIKEDGMDVPEPHAIGEYVVLEETA